MALTPEQRRVLAAIQTVAQQRRASPKEVKAAIETGIVESNLTNPSKGDADSQGWRQERASLYPNPTDLTASINRFFDETSKVKSKYGRAGDLAAAVQRPRADLRGKYQLQSGRADALLRSLGGAGASTPVAPSSTTTQYQPGSTTFDPSTESNGVGLSDLIAAQLSGQKQQAAPAAMLQDPSYSASKYVNAALPQASGAMVKPRMDVGAVLQALEAAPAVSDVQTTPGKLTTSTTPGASVAPAAGASGKATGLVALGGRAAKAEPFKVTGPDPGRLNKDLVSFARKVATIYGAPLTGSSGATHSKYTVDGNISDHYAGNATDIPASGKELIRMGRAALIAAGMPRKQALKQTGGLFNVNGHQVIFRTMQGGNHFDHLHVSAK